MGEFQTNESQNMMWYMYNDHPPNKTSTGKNGHAKGVVMATKDSAVWLIHSVPKFPPIPKSGVNKGRKNENKVEPDGRYSYPRSGMQYGQNFLCISTKDSGLDDIGTQLMYNQIIVYRYKIPGELSKKYPQLANAGRQKRIKQGPYNRVVAFQSDSGMNFTSFAKGSQWKKGRSE